MEEERKGKQVQGRWGEEMMAVAACEEIEMDEDVVCDEERVAAAMLSLFDRRNEIA